jgi:hypothetical protein
MRFDEQRLVLVHDDGGRRVTGLDAGESVAYPRATHALGHQLRQVDELDTLLRVQLDDVARYRGFGPPFLAEQHLRRHPTSLGPSAVTLRKIG